MYLFKLNKLASASLKSLRAFREVKFRSNNLKFENFSNMSTSCLLSNKHKIAICQITCKKDKNENFATLKSLITEAKQQGAEVWHL